jgi:hypothetical protein
MVSGEEVNQLRKAYPTIFLLALAFSLLAFAGISQGGQSNLEYQTCPENNAGITALGSQTQPNPVPPDAAVDVVFNQDIQYTATGITMTADTAGDLTNNLDLWMNDGVNNVLWLLDPSLGDTPLPANDTIHVHIPAGSVTVTGSDGQQQPLSQDIDFSFRTGPQEVHYLFNFVTPPTQPEQQTATLTVVKVVYGSDTPPSAFSLHVLSGGSDVTDVNNPNFTSPQPGSGTGTTYTLDPGTYTVSETVSNDVYDGYTASFTSTADPNDFTATGASGTITLAAGVAETVYVANTYQQPPTGPSTGALTVIKHVDGGTAEASDFTLYVKNSEGTVVEQGPGSETGTSYTLPSGTYTVSETVYNSVYGNVYGGYTPSFSDGGFDSYDSASGTVYLAAGGARTVTVINTYPGGSGPGPGSTMATLKVVKQVANTGGGTAVASDFQLHVMQNGVDVIDANGLKSPQPGSETGTSYTLPSGTYTVSEAVYGNYTPSFSGFDTFDSVSGTVYLAAGGARTVTVINTYSGGAGPGPGSTTGSLTVIKHVDGGTAPVSDFTLHVKQGDSEASGSPQRASLSGNIFSGLPAGTYTISESGGPSGYTASFSDGGFDTYDSVSGTVYLAAGGARTVTVTNTYSGGGSGAPGGGNSNPPGNNNPPSNNNPPGGGNNNPPAGGSPSGAGNSPGKNATGGGSPAPTTGEYPNAAPPPGPPNAAPPPGPPKLPKTGVDPGGTSAPWQVPAGILSLTVFALVVVQRKRLFSR